MIANMKVVCNDCSAKATWELVWSDGRGIVRSCAAHKNTIEHRVKKNPHADIVGWRRVRSK